MKKMVLLSLVVCVSVLCVNAQGTAVSPKTNTTATPAKQPAANSAGTMQIKVGNNPPQIKKNPSASSGGNTQHIPAKPSAAPVAK